MTTFRASLTRFAGLTGSFALLASSAHAQTNANGTPNVSGVDTIGTFLLKFIYLIDVYVVPLIFALAFIVFIWGVYRYFVAGATNEEKRNEGKQLLIYGLLGFFIMISIWGIINLLVGAFGFNNLSRPPLPTFENGAQSSGTSGGTLLPGSSGTTDSVNKQNQPTNNADTNKTPNPGGNGAPF